MAKTILQVNVVCNTGSTGRIVNMLQQSAIENGFRAVAAYGRGLPSTAGESIRIGNDFDVLRHVALTRLFDRHGCGSKGATRQFIRDIERLQPDLIHLHNIHGYYLHVKTLFDALRVMGVPIIWTLHDCWAFTGHCAYFSYVNCQKWRQGCHRCPQLRTYPASLLMDTSADAYRWKRECFTGLRNLVIVSPSQWLADHIRQSFLQEYPVEVIPNGIDLSVFHPVDGMSARSRLGLKSEQFMVLGVGNFKDFRKGFENFLRLAEHLRDKGVIVLVGLGWRQLIGLPSNVIGFTQTDNIYELVELYSAADVFVNPTLEDNYPTVNMEALACGTPVVTYASGGIPEQLTIEVGTLVPKGNINTLYKSVEEYYKRDRNHIQSVYRKHAEYRFDKEQFCSRYVLLYNKELGKQDNDNN